MPAKHVEGVTAGPGSEAVRTRSALQKVENDCEDQGYSDVKDGCNRWPCKREPLTKSALGWRCTKCGGSY